MSLPDVDIDADVAFRAKLDLTLGKLGQTIERQSRQLARFERIQQPVLRHYVSALVAPASGLLVFWLGGPDTGHKWELRNVFASGVTRSTPAPGSVDIFATAADLRMALGGAAPSLATIGTGDQRDFLTSGASSSFANPNLTATGVPAVVTVPAGQTWTLNTISFLYTASAAVASRTPRVIVRDAGGRILFQWSSSVNLSASQVAQVTLGPGLPLAAGGAGTAGNPFTPTGALPPLVLPAGSTISADAIAEDVADTITVGTVTYSTGAAGNLPMSRQYSSLQLALYAPEELFVVVSGLTPGQEIHVVADIEDVVAPANIPQVDAV